MKRYAFIIVITLVIQLILQVTANIIGNNILGLVTGVVVPTFFMTMLVLCVYNRNVSNWMDKTIWKTTRTQ